MHSFSLNILLLLLGLLLLLLLNFGHLVYCWFFSRLKISVLLVFLGLQFIVIAFGGLYFLFSLHLGHHVN